MTFSTGSYAPPIDPAYLRYPPTPKSPSPQTYSPPLKKTNPYLLTPPGLFNHFPSVPQYFSCNYPLNYVWPPVQQLVAPNYFITPSLLIPMPYNYSSQYFQPQFSSHASQSFIDQSNTPTLNLIHSYPSSHKVDEIASKSLGCNSSKTEAAKTKSSIKPALALQLTSIIPEKNCLNTPLVKTPTLSAFDAYAKNPSKKHLKAIQEEIKSAHFKLENEMFVLIDGILLPKLRSIQSLMVAGVDKNILSNILEEQIFSYCNDGKMDSRIWLHYSSAQKMIDKTYRNSSTKIANHLSSKK